MCHEVGASFAWHTRDSSKMVCDPLCVAEPKAGVLTLPSPNAGWETQVVVPETGCFYIARSVIQVTQALPGIEPTSTSFFLKGLNVASFALSFGHAPLQDHRCRN